MAKLITTDGGYGTIPNKILRNKELSCKAKGLWVYFQSKPNNWEFSADRIVEEMADGRDSILSGMKELENAGFLTRKKYKDDKGQWQWEHTLRITPTKKEVDPELDFPTTDNPTLENPTIKKEIISNKEVSISKEIDSSQPKEVSKPFNSKEWVSSLQEDSKDHIILIGYYFANYVKLDFPSLEVAKKELSKNLKPAVFLTKNFTQPEISKTLRYCQDNYSNYSWNLHTVESQILHVTKKR